METFIYSCANLNLTNYIQPSSHTNRQAAKQQSRRKQNKTNKQKKNGGGGGGGEAKSRDEHGKGRLLTSPRGMPWTCLAWSENALNCCATSRNTSEMWWWRYFVHRSSPSSSVTCLRVSRPAPARTKRAMYPSWDTRTRAHAHTHAHAHNPFCFCSFKVTTSPNTHHL